MQYDPTVRWITQTGVARTQVDLASCLDAMAVGLEIWNEQDQLVWYNQMDNYLRCAPFASADLGKKYDTLRAFDKNQARLPDGVVNDGAVLEHSTPHRAVQREPVLQELPGDRWVKNFETRTPDGYLVVARVNVTELVRQGRQLEARNRQLDLLSSTDAMTGIANRRSFDDALNAEWQRASRNGTDLSLLMVDIDHFKKYNDHYGHVAGDACLRKVAHVLSQCTRRAGDLAARYGGEEFVMLLPAADLAIAREVADKCMLNMQLEKIQHAASPTASILTLSIGVACLNDHAAGSASALINAADAALYRAKAGGRACYEIANQADWEIAADTPRTFPAPLTSG